MFSYFSGDLEKESLSLVWLCDPQLANPQWSGCLGLGRFYKCTSHILQDVFFQYFRMYFSDTFICISLIFYVCISLAMLKRKV